MYLSCCAATCDLNRGIGRLLAAASRLPEAGAPTGKTEEDNDEELIQNQYNNTQVDHKSSHRWSRGEQGRRNASESIQTILWWATTTTRRACTKFEENDAVVFVLAYFNYFQYRTTEVAECTARYNVLRKMMIATVPTYLNFLQNQSTEDARTITRFYALQTTKDTKSFALTDKSEKKMAKKKIDVTQAGSD